MARILYVEDEADRRELAAALLEKQGHQVDHVGNVADALAKMAQEQPYDVILTDNNLMRGGGDTSKGGVDLIRAARQQGFSGLTFLWSSNDESHIREQHPDFDNLNINYLCKPMSIIEVGAQIAKALVQSRPDMISQQPGGMTQENP